MNLIIESGNSWTTTVKDFTAQDTPIYALSI